MGCQTRGCAETITGSFGGGMDCRLGWGGCDGSYWECGWTNVSHFLYICRSGERGGICMVPVQNCDLSTDTTDGSGTYQQANVSRH